jgi:hypothetical protein
MNDRTAEERCCDVCGRPLKRNNFSGICAGVGSTPECRRVRDERARRAKNIPPRGRRECSQDGCRRTARADGLCGTHAARLTRTGELGPGELIRKPIVILAGEVFGKWTALEDYDLTDRRVLCRCGGCGREVRVLGATLRHGSSKGCGCRNGKPPVRRTRKPFFEGGEVYGLLTILEPARDQECLVRARCECGNEVTKRALSIKNGSTQSCGHLVQERWRTHGQSKHPLYSTWVSMLARTGDPNNHDYPNYGGRGITVCERWSVLPDGFLNFVADVGERPAGHTLDRKDNDLGYEPGNVQWKTPKEQSANRRTVRSLTREVAVRDAAIESLTAEVDRLTALLAAQGHPKPGREQRGTDSLF